MAREYKDIVTPAADSYGGDYIVTVDSVSAIPSDPGTYKVGNQLFVKRSDGSVLNSNAKPSAGRPKLLVFGNSLSLQNLTTLTQGSNYTTTTASARRGSKALVVSNAGTAASGNKLAITLYFGGVFYATIDTVPDSTHINIVEELPAAILSGATVHWYTTTGVNDWVYQYLGPVYSACMMLGMPVDVIHGYGYGGAYAQAMLADLERVLRLTNPQYVVFNLFENDLGNPVLSTSSAETDRLTRLLYLACELSIAAGAIPIFLSPYPTSGVNSAIEATNWDNMKSATLAIDTVYPQAVGIDTSTPWLGTTTSTTRPALSGWTDGVHPVINKQVVIGKMIKSALGAVIGDAGSFKNRALQYIDMTGSTGTGQGAGYSSGPVAAGITLGISANLSGTVTKTADDKQRVAVTNTAGTTFGSHYVNLVSSASLPASDVSMGGQWIKGAVRFTINDFQNIHRIQLIMTFSPGGQIHKSYSLNNSGLGAFSENGYFNGETLVYETGSIEVPNDATGYTLEIMFQPETEATVGAVIADFVVHEMGIIPGTCDLITAGL